MAKAFTTDQIIQLRNNPYTYRVTAKHIRFTKEFKELFYQKRQEGMSLRDTFASLGYDPDVLGKDRIEGISYLINKAKKPVAKPVPAKKAVSAKAHVHATQSLTRMILKLQKRTFAGCSMNSSFSGRKWIL